METVLIVCGSGASSTFLASRMRGLAKARGLDLAVEAASDSELSERLDAIDAILVGPHLAPTFDALRALAADSGVPAALLPSTAFGIGGAEAALDLVLGLLAQPALGIHTPTEGISHG